MITIQTLQTTIDGMKDIVKRDLAVTERDGKVCASTDERLVNMRFEGIGSFVASQAETQLMQGYQYFKATENGITEYVVIVQGDDGEAFRIGKIVSFQLQMLISAHKERFDKDNFFKNLLLDNLLLVDIYGRAKKLQVRNTARRIVYMLDIESDSEVNLTENVRELFPDRSKDFVTEVSENSVIIVKELRETDDVNSIESIARGIAEAVSAESAGHLRVAIGGVVNDLKDISSSYRQAKAALEVGKIFSVKSSVINYEKLGVSRLIYQLPMVLCKLFLSEVLGGVTPDQLEKETLETVDMFFEYNLNVSETSRKLSIHRNTLVYRLDKLQKQTGLDLRNFDSAIIFKIALMVSQFVEYRERDMA